MDNRFAADPDTTTPAVPTEGPDHKDYDDVADDKAAQPTREDKKMKKM